MNQSYKNCQSCGMPLKRDEKGGGTEEDGTKNSMYCSHCYQNGRFVLPHISVEEMQIRVREKIVEFGMPAFVAGIFTRKIPKLARWQGDHVAGR
jgi:NAD-dependent SIR2 family protein deacetylase